MNGIALWSAATRRRFLFFWAVATLAAKQKRRQVAALQIYSRVISMASGSTQCFRSGASLR